MKTTRSSLTAPILIGAVTAACFFSCDADHSPYARKESAASRQADSLVSTAATPSAIEIAPEEKNESGPGDLALSGENKESYFRQVFASSAARANLLDSSRRFIRTADVRFRVKDVVLATYQIENITARFNGYVANTRLASEMLGQYSTRISEDSSLETMRYQVTNQLVLRIPVANLDTTLKSLVPLIDFLDSRNVSTRDITLDILANQLQQKRQTKYNNRLYKDIDEKGKKLNDVQSAEASVLSSEEQADNAFIENLRLDDQVRYSTVTLNIYQHETFRQELVKNEKTISAYEPGLGEKIAHAAEAGWHGLREIIVFLVALWPLWLIGAGVWLFIRWLLKKKAA